MLHVKNNAVSNIQSAVLEIIPEDVRLIMLYWLDFLLLHDRTVPSLIDVIESFFKLCVNHNIKFHPTKCQLVGKYVR